MTYMIIPTLRITAERILVGGPFRENLNYHLTSWLSGLNEAKPKTLNDIKV